MAADQRGIYIQLEGTYYSRQPGKISISMPYSIELQLTDNPDFDLPANSKILSLCRNKLLPYYFVKNRKDFVDYAGIRECRIADIKKVGKKASKSNIEVSDMTMEQLFIFTFEKDLNINPSSCSSIDDARRIVLAAYEDKKLQEKTEAQKKKEAKQKKEKEFADTKEIVEFAEANSI